eukprot:128845_1
MFEMRKSLLYIFSIWIIYLVSIDNVNNDNNSWYLMIIMSMIYICYSLISIIIKEKSGIQTKLCTEIKIKLGRKSVYFASCIVVSFGLGSYYILIVLYKQSVIGLLPNKQMDIIISLIILIVSIIMLCGVIPFGAKWILYSKYTKMINDDRKDDVESDRTKTILANSLRPFFVN